jgi:hypothetical protein
MTEPQKAHRRCSKRFFANRLHRCKRSNLTCSLFIIIIIKEKRYTMNALIEKLIKDANIDEATAKKVISVVADFLEDKLPSPIDQQVVKVLNNIDNDDIQSALGAVKGLFGNN